MRMTGGCPASLLEAATFGPHGPPLAGAAGDTREQTLLPLRWTLTAQHSSLVLACAFPQCATQTHVLSLHLTRALVLPPTLGPHAPGARCAGWTEMRT
mmetsp:Transcript_55517/g.152702  ORF Transcript_55517/g.152702 Transcript_55517/m.152702 type:complete len:98 (-) Transcript_55517:139-432(-)